MSDRPTRVPTNAFFAAENPFEVIEPGFYLWSMFPRGAAWSIHHSDDRPILYLAGSDALRDALTVVLGDRLIPLALNDRLRVTEETLAEAVRMRNGSSDGSRATSECVRRSCIVPIYA